MIGDIIILNTTPPHVASIISEREAICEDGTILPYGKDALLAVSALDFIKKVEEEVLRLHETR